MEIRAVRPGEAQELRAFRLRALANAPAAYFFPIEVERNLPPEHWEAWAAGIDRVMYIAEEEEEWVAMAGCILRDTTLDATGMWVAPAARGRNLGERLIDAIVAWGRDRQATRMEFAVTENNAVAIALYERLGFTPTGRRRRLASRPDLVGMFMARAL